MDLAAVLDATEPVECEFLNHKITAYVYTAGPARLTKEQRAILRSVDETIEITDETEANEELSRQAQNHIYDRNIDMARKLVPIMVGKWDFDGTPLTVGDEELPPTAENMTRCPDDMVMEVALKAVDVWRRPTNGGLLPTGSPQDQTLKPNPEEPAAIST